MFKKNLAIIICITMMISTVMVVTAEEGNNNLYPDPREGLQKIKNESFIYTNDYDYNYHSLVINGSGKSGFVTTGNGSEKNITHIYTLEVLEEGMVSVDLSTADGIDENAHIYVIVHMNETRTVPESVSINPDVKTWLYNTSKNRIQEKYIFYAYPGYYYLQVRGSDRNATGNKALSYTIQATQEVFPQEFVNMSVNTNDSDYPNNLGTTSFSDSIKVSSTLSMETWATKTSGGDLYVKNSNSRDYFVFIPTVSGTVNYAISNRKTEMLDAFLTAYTIPT